MLSPRGALIGLVGLAIAAIWHVGCAQQGAESPSPSAQAPPEPAPAPRPAPATRTVPTAASAGDINKRLIDEWLAGDSAAAPQKSTTRRSLKPPPPLEEDKVSTVWRAYFKGLDQVTGKTEFGAADVAKVVKLYPQFRLFASGDKRLGIARDERFAQLIETNIKEAYDYVVANPKRYALWAQMSEMQLDAFLRCAFRVSTTRMKVLTPDALEAKLKGRRAPIERTRQQWTAQEYAQAMADMDEEQRGIARMRALFDELIPGPTEAERRLLEIHKRELSEVFGAE
jgi:hypothetical protein